MSKRQYSTRWTYDVTVKFIKARIKLEKIFTGKFYDLRTSWEKVVEEAGIEDDWGKLKKKWSNIMTKYKTIIEPPTGLGREDEGPEPLTWPYFELMHDYASARHNINPPNIWDTAPPAETETEVIFLNTEDSNSISEGSTSRSESRDMPSTSRGERSSSRCSSRKDKNAKLMRHAAKRLLNTWL